MRSPRGAVVEGAVADGSPAAAPAPTR
jgi:hypothetical protein